MVVDLFQTPSEFDASSLYHAMKGIGTEEGTLIEIIGTRPHTTIPNKAIIQSNVQQRFSEMGRE